MIAAGVYRGAIEGPQCIEVNTIKQTFAGVVNYSQIG